MKNILSREEFLSQQMNEGFVDSIKKGFNKVKNFFRIGMAKIKDMIVVFGNNGRVIPVVTPAAIIDKSAGSKTVQVYASPEMHSYVKSIGGKTDGLTTPQPLNVEQYNDSPSGLEYAQWIQSGKYKETTEYKNFATLTKVLGLNESKNVEHDIDSKPVNEIKSFKDAVKNRVQYLSSEGEDLEDTFTYKFPDFEKLLNKSLTDRGKIDPEKTFIYLVFGASGIGKSSIFNTVVEKYNKEKSADNKISLIRVDCATLGSENWFMPVLPKAQKVVDYIKNHPETFPKSVIHTDKLSVGMQEYQELAKHFEDIPIQSTELSLIHI